MNRSLPAIALVLALVSGVLVVQPTNAAMPPCAKHVGTVPERLPASVEITTSCARYTIASRGLVTIARRPPLPRGISWMQIAGPGAALADRGGRIAVLRGGREVWRSTGQFRINGVFARVGPQAVAFSYDDFAHGSSGPSLYVARLNGSERKVASGELPLGWTAAGRLLSWRFRHGFFGVFLRRPDGSLLRQAGARIRELRFEPATGTALALTRAGALERYDGRWHRLADLRALGFGKHASFEPLAGGLIGVLEARHVAVLRRDGTRFASARLPGHGRFFTVAGQSGLVANNSGSTVAFAVTRGNNGYARVGRESLYVLRAGDREPTQIYDGRLRFAVCERWADLDWHGDWLLYATTEGKTIAIDTRPPARTIDLTRLVARFASKDGEGKVYAQVRWADGGER